MRWRRRNAYYYRSIERLALDHLGTGGRVLDVDADLGDLLAAMRPSFGLGLTRTPERARFAARRFPGLRFVVGDPEALPVGEPFDKIVLVNAIGSMHDVTETLARLRGACHNGTSLFLTYYNFVWEPILKAGERLGLKQPEPDLNWLGMADIRNVLFLAGYDVKGSGASLLLPRYVPVASEIAERYLMRTRAFQAFALVQYFVARPRPLPEPAPLSVSVVVPVRNEVGNVAPCIERTPKLGPRTELIFVDGASTDGTRERILELIAAGVRADLEIRLVDQITGPDPTARRDRRATMLKLGKGHAVRLGFQVATGDVLIILDGDLTVPPEDLPKFYEPVARGEAGFMNGSRLVYPLEEGAMRPLHLAANRFFGIVFTWLLGQRVKDTLCGTKAIRKADYERLDRDRATIGAFDPFGDFDLLVGAARLGLRILEVPVRYRRRTFGHSKIRSLEHGLLLLRMVLVGLWKLKLRRVLFPAAPGSGARAAEGTTHRPDSGEEGG